MSTWGHWPIDFFFFLTTVTPVFKSGNKTSTSNYRPISHTSTIIKVFERIIRKQVVAFMNRQGHLNNTQHGFRSGRSCLSALLDVFDDLMHMFSSDTIVDMIYRLQRFQNQCARILTKSQRREHITPVLKSLHWLKIQDRITYKIFMLTYKSYHNIAPTYLCELISRRESSVNTRLGSDQHQLIMPPISKDCSFLERSFIYAAPCEWNKLSECIRTSSFDSFRKSVKTMLFTQQYGC